MFSRLAIRRRVTTMMITMMVFLAGIVSYMNLDMDLMPEIDIPIVVVSTTYVGAGPEEIENLVTKPLEESLSTVSNVENITSVSSANMSMVMVQFVRISTSLPWTCVTSSTAQSPHCLTMPMNQTSSKWI